MNVWPSLVNWKNQTILAMKKNHQHAKWTLITTQHSNSVKKNCSQTYNLKFNTTNKVAPGTISAFKNRFKYSGADEHVHNSDIWSTKLSWKCFRRLISWLHKFLSNNGQSRDARRACVLFITLKGVGCSRNIFMTFLAAKSLTSTVTQVAFII